MPDNAEGYPFRDGEGPNSQDRGAADEAFAAVVLDEEFVEAAAIHEPSAAERILYAALERAESEAVTEHSPYPDLDFDAGTPDGAGGYPVDADLRDLDEDLEDEEPDDEEGRFDRSDYTRYLSDEDEEELGYGGYAGYPAPGALTGRAAAPRGGWRPARWQRPVACVLAMVMGISVIAFALIAIQRAGSSAQRGEPTPLPASPADGPDDGLPADVEADVPEDDR
ncbi:hypothetical protein [Streptomyces sp. B6B3]|uniref:SCO2584 family spore wall biosynthesis protein n=1 Tax=Streptomyces sp. B6B3 TaxID=3153570 RepID=UPI00325E7140